MKKPRPLVPEPPLPLSLYWEIKQMNMPLLSGGLLDQPDHIWQLVVLAGRAFEGK